MCELGLNRHQFCHEESPCRPQRQPLFSTEISDPALSTVRSLGRHGLWSPSGKRIGARSLPPRGMPSAFAYPDPAQCPEEFCRWLDADRWGIPWSGIAAHDGCDRSPRPAVDPAAPNPANSAAELGLYEAVSDKYRLFQLATCSGSEGSRNGPGLPGGFGRSRGQGLALSPRHQTPQIDHATRFRDRNRSVRYAAIGVSWSAPSRACSSMRRDELLIQEYVSGEGAGVFWFVRVRGGRDSFRSSPHSRKSHLVGVSVFCARACGLPRRAWRRRAACSIRSVHGVAMVELQDRRVRPHVAHRKSTRASGAPCNSQWTVAQTSPGSCTRSPQAQALKFPPIIHRQPAALVVGRSRQSICPSARLALDTDCAGQG